MENVLTDPSGPSGQKATESTPAEPVTSLPIKRLYRDPSGPIGGVAAGMAAYFGVDPVLVRLLWLVALFSGIGFFAYLMFWVIVPKARVWPPPAYPSTLGAGAAGEGVSGALIMGLFVVALAAVLGTSLGGLGDFVLPVALVGFGIYLLNQRGALSPAPTPSVPVRYDGAIGEGEPNSTAAGARLNVTSLVLSLLALLGGIAWALHSAGVIALSMTLCFAVALIVVGLGSVASLWLGRARGLLPIGIGLSACLLVAAVFEPWLAREKGALAMDHRQLTQDIGDATHRPSSLAELQRQYGLGMGELTLDLSELDLQGTTQNVTVKLGMGEALVIVPKDVTVEVHGEVAMGSAEVFGVVSEGVGRVVEEREEGPAPGRLVIRLEVGLGEGKVRRGI